jgi:hypothetical protein
MSMHLVGPWLTTNSTGKKKGKKKWASAEHKRRALQARTEYEEMVKKYELKPKKKLVSQGNYKPTPVVSLRHPINDTTAPSIQSTWDPCIRKEPTFYTGTLVKGLAVMHKSNIVPIINEEEAKDVARMRRG